MKSPQLHRGPATVVGVLRHLGTTLATAILLISAQAAPAAALDANDYFVISYDMTFSQDEVFEGETFSVAVTGRAVCIKDLPLTPSEVIITGRVVAEHQGGGARVTLNPEYTVSISPFPYLEGDSSQVTSSVPLQFPEGSQPGDYIVSGELIEAKLRAVLLFDVTDYLPPSELMGSVSYMPPADESPPPPDGPGEPPPGTTDISANIDASGNITDTTYAPSADGKWVVKLEAGSRALDNRGRPLESITIEQMLAPPLPPAESSIIGLAFQLGPEGTVFEPPATLTITYDEGDLPQGVAEENLVIAFWDAALGSWVELEGCIVDSSANTISVSIGHFSTFAVMAGTAAAAFSLSDLTISPTEANQGQNITISVLVSNGGNLAGEYEVSFSLVGEVVEVRQLALPVGVSDTVTFSIRAGEAGEYVFSINGLAGSFSVNEPQQQPAESTMPPPGGGVLETPGETGEGGFGFSTIIYIADAALVGVILWLILKRHRTA